MIKVEHLSKSYDGKVIIKDFSYLFAKNLYLIKGKSGCGKTTLIKILLGLDNDYQGEVYYDNLNISKLSPNERSALLVNKICYIPQGDNLLNNLTVIDNIYLILKLRSKNFTETEIDCYLNEFDLYQFRNQKVMYLSGGQKKRIEILFSLFSDAEIVIADEPFAGLDSEYQEKIAKLFNDYAQTKLVIIINHEDQVDIKYQHLIDFNDLASIKQLSEIKSNSNKEAMKIEEDINNKFLFSPLIKSNLKKSFFSNVLNLSFLIILFFCLVTTTITKGKSTGTIQKQILSETPYSLFEVKKPNMTAEDYNYLKNNYQELVPYYISKGEEIFSPNFVFLVNNNLNLKKDEAVISDYLFEVFKATGHIDESSLIENEIGEKWIFAEDGLDLTIIDYQVTNYQILTQNEDWLLQSLPYSYIYINEETFNTLKFDLKNFGFYTPLSIVDKLVDIGYPVLYHTRGDIVNAVGFRSMYKIIGIILTFLVCGIYLLISVINPNIGIKRHKKEIIAFQNRGFNFYFFIKNYLLIDLIIILVSSFIGGLLSLIPYNYFNKQSMGFISLKIYHYNFYLLSVLIIITLLISINYLLYKRYFKNFRLNETK